MYVFQVTPWDTYAQIKTRRQHVAVHGEIGQDHLERGHYELAKAEFERSLALDPLDEFAQRGRYLAELFISLALPTWDASVWSAVRDPLARFARRRDRDVAHVIEKYQGDVEKAISNDSAAREHYERALRLRPDYLDALHTYGWFHYSRQPDIAQMERMFRRMTEVDPYDYRGFHGRGYALYMQALKVSDANRQRTLMVTATDQALRAVMLRIQQLNVAMDLGEIARSVNPELSIYLHRSGNRLLDAEETAALPQNRNPLGVQLLMSRLYVYVGNDSQRRAWINYQLALDHLAISRRLRAEGGVSGDLRKQQAEHVRLLKVARELDKDGSIYPIYNDGLATLEFLTPVDPASHGGVGRR